MPRFAGNITSHAQASGQLPSDHHGASVTVDNTIARYHGTDGTLQGYTSNGPTVGDTGQINLDHGTMQWPTTQVPNAAPNAMDDYQEADWTPAIQFGGAAVGLSTSVSAGKATKIGRAIHCSFEIALTAKGSSTGLAKIAGLPETSENASGVLAGFSANFDAITYGGMLLGRVDKNDTTVSLVACSEAGVASNITDAGFANNTILRGSFTYIVPT